MSTPSTPPDDVIVTAALTRLCDLAGPSAADYDDPALLAEALGGPAAGLAAIMADLDGRHRRVGRHRLQPRHPGGRGPGSGVRPPR